MKTALIIIGLVIAFGVVGRMDYESELTMQQARAESSQKFIAKACR